MKKYLVISGSGPDRVGLVDAISGFISSKKLNIEDSRMAVLGGDFALILLVSGDEAGIGKLKENLAELKSKTGLSLTARASSAPEARQVEAALPYRMAVSGMDYPGIVKQFTNILHHAGVNIESLESRVSPAPLSGTPVFSMNCRLAVPAKVKIAQLKSDLNQAADEGNLDFDFEPINR